MSEPTLRNPFQGWSFTAERSPEEAAKAPNATAIIRNGKGEMIGAYVDCEEGEGTLGSPEQKQARDQIAKSLTKTNGLVVMTIYTNEPNHRLPGVLTVIIWYPFHMGAGWRPPRHQQGYALQWWFSWPNDKPPTRFQRLRLLAWTRLRHPKALILTY